MQTQREIYDNKAKELFEQTEANNKDMKFLQKEFDILGFYDNENSKELKRLMQTDDVINDSNTTPLTKVIYNIFKAIKTGKIKLSEIDVR